MPRPLRFLVVDDNLASATTAMVILENAGYAAEICTAALEVVDTVQRQQPDGVLLDIMMPGVDGLEVCRRLRATPGLEDLKIVMLTAKAYEYDRRRAAELGADGYIQKPVRKATMLETIAKVMTNQVELHFWGVRGTLPRPGPDSVRYGGNTSCVSLAFPRGQLLIFDAGTGIKNLGDHLMARGGRVEGKILISHPHWDHINTLPFFSPLYVAGNDFEIVGASHGETTMRSLVSAQMDGVYFPITIREFGANVAFRDLHEGSYEIAGVKVDTLLLSHPGNCLGYRVRHGGRTICYVTDNELFLPTSPSYTEEYVERLADFVCEADALVTDTTYFDSEYESKVGWGHSCVSQVVDLAHRARVRNLYLFHHDPDQDDDAIDRKLETAGKLLHERGSETVCLAPREGELVRV
jgi:CheY-like chemotaxis protein/phosphoribosyl 1,2-cyclic phosphodiesterase